MEQTLKSLQKIGTIINDVCKVLLGTQIIILLAITVIQVILRRLNHSISWITEFSSLLFVWMTLLGSAIAIKYFLHIGVDIIRDRLKGKVKTYFMFISHVILIVGILVITSTGYSFTIANIHHVGTTVPISLAWFYCSIPICGVIMLYNTFVQLLEILHYGDVVPVILDALFEEE